MIVVSDSTPLITLMKAASLHVLNGLFGDVLIPRAVFSELTNNRAFRDEADLIRNSDYIRVVDVPHPELVDLLQRAAGLDRGESEAIIYADEIGADLLLMDESAGRRVAQNMRLPIAGSIGVLVKACQSGLLSREETEKALFRIKEANRHISSRLIEDALEVIRREE